MRILAVTTLRERGPVYRRMGGAYAGHWGDRSAGLYQ